MIGIFHRPVLLPAESRILLDTQKETILSSKVFFILVLSYSCWFPPQPSWLNNSIKVLSSGKGILQQQFEYVHMKSEGGEGKSVKRQKFQVPLAEQKSTVVSNVA